MVTKRKIKSDGSGNPEVAKAPARPRTASQSKAQANGTETNGANGTNGSHSTNGARQLATLDPTAVAARAYQLYVAEGRQNGKDLDHWLRAESELAEDAAD